MLFFSRKFRAERDDLIQEKWTADFPALFRKRTGAGSSPFRRRKEHELAVRFPRESGDGYEGLLGHRGYELELQRENLFAWIADPWFRYSDFLLEAECSFDENNGYSALGFCFRQINEASYYYFLVSSRGFFRFDVVFNDNPRILIPWTPVPQEPSGEGYPEGEEGKEEGEGKPDENFPPWGASLRIRIIATGTRFVFLLNDEWAAEVDDDTIPGGGVAWAGQNYDEKPEARVRLERIKLESRPVEAEAAYYRWTDYVPVEPDARVRLAESFLVIEAWTAAIIQLKKVLRQRPLSPDELLLLARAFLGAGLFQEALNTAARYETEFGAGPESLEITGSGLYGLNRFLELRDFLKKNKDALSGFDWYYGLLGNGEYALGNWEKAAGAYEKALARFPDSPLVKENLLRARAKLGAAPPGALYDTALLYFQREDCENAKLFLRQAREAREAREGIPGDPETQETLGTPETSEPPEARELSRKIRILEGKIAFQEERWQEAEDIFQNLAETPAGSQEEAAEDLPEESSVYFLYGLLLNRRGEKVRAGGYLETAAEMEPEEFVFQFKAAESRHLRGESPEPFLARGLALEASDPWIYNLAGLDAMERGRYLQAADYLSRARELEPENPEILINYSQALFDAGEPRRALEVLGDSREPEILNHGGNLLTAMDDFSGALGYYEEALSLDPRNRMIRLNLASACIESDHIHRAEEILQGFGEEPDPEVYNLLGNLAAIRGEYFRAEEAYRSALAMDEDNPGYLLNLADLYYIKKKYPEALETIGRIPPALLTRRAERLKTAITDALEVGFQCTGCGRQWTAPRDIPVQGPLKLRGELPGDLPAGRCPQCGTVYCVECARPYVEEGRFFCPSCGGRLSQEDKHLRYILKEKLAIPR